MRRNGHKFNAVRTEVDGHSFASKAEARRYSELKLLEKAGEIRSLTLQPVFPIRAHGQGFSEKPIANYRGDFGYEESYTLNGRLCWRYVVEDVKGVKTAVYRLKKKLVEAQHGITITEVA